MDGDRFDELIQRLGRLTTRRGAAGLLAAILGGRTAGEVGARSRHQRHRDRRQAAEAECTGTGGPCAADDECCSARCSADERGDPPARRCCQAKGKRCKRHSQCCSGRCKDERCSGEAAREASETAPSPEDQTERTEAQTASETCGAIGAPCTDKNTCCSGACSHDERGKPRTTRCCLPLDESCKSGSQCCSGQCHKKSKRCVCLAAGKSCTSTTAYKCCSGECSGGKCAGKVQLVEDGPCATSEGSGLVCNGVCRVGVECCTDAQCFHPGKRWCSASGQCVACREAADCPAQPCQSTTCRDDGSCAYERLPNGTGCGDGTGLCCRGTCVEGAQCCTDAQCPCPDCPENATTCTTEGQCVACEAATDCPEVPCQEAICKASGGCAYTPLADGVTCQIEGESGVCCAGNCQTGAACCTDAECDNPDRPWCSANGQCVACRNTDDCAPVACQRVGCTPDGTCAYESKSDGSACRVAQGLGVCCAGSCEVDTECCADADCSEHPTGTVCVAGQCVECRETTDCASEPCSEVTCSEEYTCDYSTSPDGGPGPDCPTTCCGGICCPEGQVCGANGKCCAPLQTCPSGACGEVPDGCGGTIPCGECPAKTCQSAACTADNTCSFTTQPNGQPGTNCPDPQVCCNGACVDGLCQAEEAGICQAGSGYICSQPVSTRTYCGPAADPQNCFCVNTVAGDVVCVEGCPPPPAPCDCYSFPTCTTQSDCAPGTFCIPGGPEGSLGGPPSGCCPSNRNLCIGACPGTKACTPLSTCPAGACGSVPDGCGGTIDCGTCLDQTCRSATCTANNTCSYATQANGQPGTNCPAPQVCCSGKCCATNQVCQAGVCCAPLTKSAACSGKCGTVTDGCGGTYDCGACACTCQNYACYANKWGTRGTGASQFDAPVGPVAGPDGLLYIADQNNHRIQVYQTDGTFVRQWGSSGAGEGQFTYPVGIGVAADGTVYVADYGNHRVQYFKPDGTFLGKWGSQGTGNGQFRNPYDVAIAADGTIYVADHSNHRVQSFSAPGVYKGQWGGFGSTDGKFSQPIGVSVAPDGTVYVTDSSNHRVQVFTANGTFLRKWGTYGSGNGQFAGPYRVALAADGRVYVTDHGNHRVQVFTTQGTFQGAWGTWGSENGQLKHPTGVAIVGNMAYIGEMNNHRLQVFCIAQKACTPVTTCPAGACGKVPDGCGGTIECGLCADQTCQSATCTANNTCSYATQANGQPGTNCPAPQVCCSGNCCTQGQVCFEGGCCTPSPQSETCAGKCGTVSDGCGGTHDCGTCPAKTCQSGTCTAENTCSYTNQPDNAPGTDCAAPGFCCTGTCCAEGTVCHAGTCCTPLSKTAACSGKCGTVSDGCGGTHDCGTCPTKTCQSGTCTAEKICSYTNQPNGQAGTNCASPRVCCNGTCCATGQVCDAGNTCCTPLSTCPAGACGAIPDGCGGTVQCGTCPAKACQSATCSAEKICVYAQQPNGQAGNLCPAPRVCCSGTCCASGQICTVSNQCCTPVSKTVACSGKCGVVSNGCGGTHDCGGCQNPKPICSASNICEACTSSSQCGTGKTCCSGSCVDLQTDKANCGQCGKVCPGEQTCQAGNCVCICGKSTCFLRKWGNYGSGDGQLNNPWGVALGPDGNIYVADTYNHRIQVFTTNGAFVRKWGSNGSGDGQFQSPYRVIVGPDGNVYVADTYNHRIQVFTANGAFVRKWGSNGSGDGQFQYTVGMRVGPDGNVYVADVNSHRIQVFTTNGAFVRKWGSYGSGDGQFVYTGDVVVGPNGTVYVTDLGGHRIQAFCISP